MSSNNDAYVNLTVTGRIFPSWILHNFKQYKLPEILRNENEDPCNVQTKLELRKYQEFIGKYLGPGSPYNSILLYHGLGSGKTATSINLMNVLYNYNHEYNFVILIKASLRDDPWMKDLKVWLGREPSEANVESITNLARYNNIHFVHYDSPYANRDFLDTMKKIDTSKPTMYIIDEAHNFIRNVYSNINSKIGKRAQVIYDYILKDKRENKDTKVVLISATPGINTPFELSLLFNLLRPGIFPTSEVEFNRTFITDSAYPILNPLKKNMFERRIMGLVSYYIGATPDLYARQELKYVNLPMSDYQYSVYRVFEKLEEAIQKKAIRFGKQSKLYRTYTRQASNFVFPYVNSDVTGELRPRPGKFRVTEKVVDDIEKGKIRDLVAVDDKEAARAYIKAMEVFQVETTKYFQNINRKDVANGHTVLDDLKEFSENFNTKYSGKFMKFWNADRKKSDLLIEMYNCSPKFTAIVFTSDASPGKVMVYTNYVFMEGIDMLKVYYQLIGFNNFTNSQPNKGFCEYHGRIPSEDRVKIKNMFNEPSNIRGLKCKVIMLSPSATEGIQLYGIRQEHITEPYWTEVRIQQVVGRGIRQCSHKDLPMDERVVIVYRYKMTKPENLDADDVVLHTTDQYIEDQAKAKANLIESFLGPMKEVAVDCELFKAHNQMSQSYTCFKFPESTISGKNIGPAYKEDLKDDVKYDSGLHAKNTTVERVKVIKVQAVHNISNTDTPDYTTPDTYWYNPKNGMIYDYETHYPVGKVAFVGELPNKLDKDTYIISDIFEIPNIGTTANL